MNNLLPSKTGELYYIPNFLSPDKATYLFDSLKSDVSWEQKHITIYDKNIPLPRLTAWFGDNPNVTYKYSNIHNTPQAWHPLLLKLKNYIEEKFKAKINSGLLNLYRDQNDGLGWHSDNEKELGLTPIIFSLSLGETRTFQVKDKLTGKNKINLELNNGDLVIMKGDMQQKWLHRIAPTTKIKGERINITFRFIYTHHL